MEEKTTGIFRFRYGGREDYIRVNFETLGKNLIDTKMSMIIQNNET